MSKEIIYYILNVVGMVIIWHLAYRKPSKKINAKEWLYFLAMIVIASTLIKL